MDFRTAARAPRRRAPPARKRLLDSTTRLYNRCGKRADGRQRSWEAMNMMKRPKRAYDRYTEAVAAVLFPQMMDPRGRDVQPHRVAADFVVLKYRPHGLADGPQPRPFRPAA